MASDVLLLYRQLRADRALSHTRACEDIAERLEVDFYTAQRVVRRAEHEDARGSGAPAPLVTGGSTVTADAA